MAREGDLIRKAFKRHMLPGLASIGFVGRMPNFQRLFPDSQDLLTIQYHKYGGSFILEFGRRQRGSLQTSWGPLVAEEKVEVIYLPTNQRARLQEVESQASDLFAGFSFQHFDEDEQAYEALAIRVLGLLPQVDAWLSSGAKGPNVQALGVVSPIV
jgi:hypothetical protein